MLYPPNTKQSQGIAVLWHFWDIPCDIFLQFKKCQALSQQKKRNYVQNISGSAASSYESANLC